MNRNQVKLSYSLHSIPLLGLHQLRGDAQLTLVDVVPSIFEHLG